MPRVASGEDSEDDAASIKSGKSGGNSFASRSTTSSAISMHARSYSYLSERVYDYFQARSAWINRVQQQQQEGGIHDIGSEEAALKRLPADFDPLIFTDTRRQLPSCLLESAVDDSATRHSDGSDSDGKMTMRKDVVTPWNFEPLYRVSSSRAWDRLYLLLGLTWSILAPARMDGVSTVEAQDLAYLALMMFASAAVPVTLGVFLKAFFFETLRTRLRDDRYWAGVFFVLATKSISITAVISYCCNQCRGHDRSERRAEGWDDESREEAVVDKARKDEKDDDSVGVRGGEISVSCRDEDQQAAAKHDTEVSKLPPGHWMCSVCKEINAFPSEWNGKPGKKLQVVIKRKAIDKQSMFAVFQTKPNFPLCRKCQSPFNYTWRNRRMNKVAQQLHGFDEIRSGATSAEKAGATGATPPQIASNSLSFFKPIRNILTSKQNSVKEEGYDYSGGLELWYGREFIRQLETYFKPQLNRPSLSTRYDHYPVGARVECFVGKTAWYPGTVTASRENNTYDVCFDNGDVAQHVLQRTVRFQPIHKDSSLVCCFYGLVLAAVVISPLAGVSGGAVFTVMLALLLGMAGVLALVVQFYAIYRENREAGPWIPACFAFALALPWASLGLLGGLSIAKLFVANNHSSVGSWVEVLFLPGVFFCLTVGGYAHAVSPAYGKAWAAASLFLLLFLLLASLRLDGKAGGLSPAALGGMKWLGVFSPLWIFVLLVMLGHHVLPHVWDVEVFPSAEGQNDLSLQAREMMAWLSGLVGTIRGSISRRLAAFLREVRRESESNASSIVDDDSETLENH